MFSEKKNNGQIAPLGFSWLAAAAMGCSLAPRQVSWPLASAVEAWPLASSSRHNGGSRQEDVQVRYQDLDGQLSRFPVDIPSKSFKFRRGERSHRIFWHGQWISRVFVLGCFRIHEGCMGPGWGFSFGNKFESKCPSEMGIKMGTCASWCNVRV